MKKAGRNEAEKKVIGYRKSCTAEGVGLSHYILVRTDTEVRTGLGEKK